MSARIAAQAQFHTCDMPAIVESFFATGRILLRQCFDIDVLKEIRSELQEIHRHKNHPHAYFRTSWAARCRISA